jgi:hypothetical protein
MLADRPISITEVPLSLLLQKHMMVASFVVETYVVFRIYCGQS